MIISEVAASFAGEEREILKSNKDKQFDVGITAYKLMMFIGQFPGFEALARTGAYFKALIKLNNLKPREMWQHKAIVL